MENRRALGNLGEDFACQFLIDKGHKIIIRNYSCRWGEIDIISLCNGELFFVEVKTRRSIAMGYPSESVTEKKLTKMRRAASDFLAKSNFRYPKWSFKVIEIYVNEIDEL